MLLLLVSLMVGVALFVVMMVEEGGGKGVRGTAVMQVVEMVQKDYDNHDKIVDTIALTG